MLIGFGAIDLVIFTPLFIYLISEDQYKYSYVINKTIIDINYEVKRAILSEITIQIFPVIYNSYNFLIKIFALTQERVEKVVTTPLRSTPFKIKV